MAAVVVAVSRVEVVAGVSTSGTSDGVTRSRLKGSVEPASRQPSLGGGLGGLVFSVVPACGAAAAGGGRSTAPEGAAERSIGGGGPSPGALVGVGVHVAVAAAGGGIEVAAVVVAVRMEAECSTRRTSIRWRVRWSRSAPLYFCRRTSSFLKSSSRGQSVFERGVAVRCSRWRLRRPWRFRSSGGIGVGVSALKSSSVC